MQDGITGEIRCAHLVDPCMHIQHELQEMLAFLLRYWQGIEEHIHQHGFAAPDIAPDVEAIRARLAGVMQQRHREQACTRSLRGEEIRLGDRFKKGLEFEHHRPLHEV